MKSIGTHNRSIPAALSVSRIVLRLLLILNWIYGGAILILLIATSINGAWMIAALGIPPSATTMLRGMQAVALLGLLSIPLHYVILRRLLDMVESMRAGDPFVRQNASRLQAIAWALLGLQLLSIAIGAIAVIVSTVEHPLHLDAGFSTSGWLAVLLLFVLARVFGEGARMRDELEGMV